MDASALHVVTCVANPVMWESRIRLAKQFITHMLDSGVDLTVVETAYGERPFELADIPHIHHIPTRATTMAWSKESALNVGIRSLPPTAKYVCWADSDIEFRDPKWAGKTVDALQLAPVIQPWSEALDLGPAGEVMTVKGTQVQTSFGWVWREHGDVTTWWKKQQAGEPYSYPHSGYCWAATMDILNAIGLLLDFSGLGAADHQMSLGMVGLGTNAIHGLSSDAYRNSVKAWCDRGFAKVEGHVNYIPGRIEHSFHGPKELRKYVGRWDILNKWKFDPATDLHRNRWGILELSGNKPGLMRDIEGYFRGRAEDANYLGSP